MVKKKVNEVKMVACTLSNRDALNQAKSVMISSGHSATWNDVSANIVTSAGTGQCGNRIREGGRNRYERVTPRGFRKECFFFNLKDVNAVF